LLGPLASKISHALRDAITRADKLSIRCFPTSHTKAESAQQTKLSVALVVRACRRTSKFAPLANPSVKRPSVCVRLSLGGQSNCGRRTSQHHCSEPWRQHSACRGNEHLIRHRTATGLHSRDQASIDFRKDGVSCGAPRANEGSVIMLHRRGHAYIQSGS